MKRRCRKPTAFSGKSGLWFEGFGAALVSRGQEVCRRVAASDRQMWCVLLPNPTDSQIKRSSGSNNKAGNGTEHFLVGSVKA